MSVVFRMHVAIMFDSIFNNHRRVPEPETLHPDTRDPRALGPHSQVQKQKEVYSLEFRVRVQGIGLG